MICSIDKNGNVSFRSMTWDDVIPDPRIKHVHVEYDFCPKCGAECESLTREGLPCRWECGSKRGAFMDTTSEETRVLPITLGPFEQSKICRCIEVQTGLFEIPGIHY